MSKMFDALRWAEDQRKKITSRIQDYQLAKPDVLRQRPLNGAGTPLSPTMVRELGILRNSLEALFEGSATRSIIFTSAAVGEGTTTVTTNFAKFLAMQGMERLLVCEMNARRPAFANIFSVNGDGGITDYFSADASLSNLVQTSPVADIDILQAGRRDPMVLQIKMNRMFPEFLRDAHQHYDTILIDAPPVLNYPETPPMTAFASGVVMVVHAGKTKREIVTRAMETIGNFNGNVVGVVLNRKKYYIPEFLYKRL